MTHDRTSHDETADRYVVISSDCHAGASIPMYGEYLEARYRDDFVAWEASFVNPYQDLLDTESTRVRAQLRQSRPPAPARSGRHRRRGDLPQHHSSVLPERHPHAAGPTPEQYELRWAGIRAHNRWLADFCNELPGRRAGVAQLLLNDVDDALDEVRRVKDDGLFGGVMIPNIAPDSHLPPLHAPIYEPLWALCEELALPVNMHGGTGVPNLGPYPATPALMFLEFGWYAQRPLLRLLFSRRVRAPPGAHVHHDRAGQLLGPRACSPGSIGRSSACSASPAASRREFGGEIARSLSLKPSEYWERQCYLGASFMGPHDCAVREDTGVDRIMWGSDYPHSEGTHPYTKEALRYTFADVDARRGAPHARHQRGARVRVRSRRARPRSPIEFGPLVAEVAVPLGADEFPADALSPALDRMRKPVGNIS